jgi:hypothetical protein
MRHSDLAALAQRAYTATPEWQCAGHVRAMLDIVDGVPVVSVPGTDPMSFADDSRDLDCDQVFVPGLGYCHDGFQSAALSIWPMVKETLFANGKHAPRITFTGHSLGGAIAVILAALTLRDKLADEVELVTFGCPRVGAQRLALSLFSAKKTLYRFGIDPVTQVPFTWLFHLPPVVYMHPTTISRIGAPELPLICNHAISNYVTELQRLGL